MERLEVTEEITITISPIVRTQMFEGYVVISDAEVLNLINALYTKDEQELIIGNLAEFYGEDDKTNALNDEFHRILEEGGRYES